MYPVLLRIGALEIRAYGLLLALSFLIGIYLSVRRAKSRGIDPNHIMDLSVILIVSAIVGSRLLYVLFHLDEFRGHWLDTVNPFQSDGQIGIAGLTVLGGIVLCFISAVIYLRMKKLPFYKFADVLMPAVGFGIFLTRIGCFLNGCCFGLPCEGHGHLCVTFPLNSAAGSQFPGVPLVPAQLYSSLYGLIIFIALLLVERWKKFDGFLLAIFLILYGIARFIIDIYRYYEDSMVILPMGDRGISLNQGISIIFVLAGIILLIIGYNKIKRTAAGKVSS
ncbi:prolipoprotein diacylglyceryl transferase [candidate division KSB1 bacterium]|nr:prolipoprotein diacylglyceryl transferase [candidate division KSB1 bacterium]RQW10223.1 MAG: prolipoprotein diacylglyceryl transferase [candidate division KSB1 bacterium]